MEDDKCDIVLIIGNFTFDIISLVNFIAKNINLHNQRKCHWQSVISDIIWAIYLNYLYFITNCELNSLLNHINEMLLPSVVSFVKQS